MQQDPIPDDVREYVSRHHLIDFEESLWSPIVQRMIRLRIQMEKNGKIPMKRDTDYPSSFIWLHWQG